MLEDYIAVLFFNVEVVLYYLLECDDYFQVSFKIVTDSSKLTTCNEIQQFEYLFIGRSSS